MEYEQLLQKVLEAQRQKKYDSFQETERELIILLLSELKEGITQNRFLHAGRTRRTIEIFEVQFHYNFIHIHTKHKHGSSNVHAIKCSFRENVNTEVITNSMQSLGLECKSVMRNKHVEELIITIDLKARKEAP